MIGRLFKRKKKPKPKPKERKKMTSKPAPEEKKGKGAIHKILTAEGWKRLMMRKYGKMKKR